MQDIIDIIKNYEVKGSKFGLERTRNLLNAFGSPDDDLKIIHVAGTNGKGSICSYITNIIVAEGKSVGTFTSPEVYSYNEKFMINGVPAKDDVLKKYLNLAYDKAMTFEDKPTAFEIETAAALYMFASEGCEYAVVECGMGGLNDSTNAINKKVVCAIGAINLEHTAILGKTITEICKQKAGIIKNCPAVVSAYQTAEGREYFESLNVKFADGVKVVKKKSNLKSQTFTYDGEEYSIQMLGLVQAYNAAVAIEVARILGLSQSAIKNGLFATKLDGRLEIIEGAQTYVLDGCHNPAAFAPLCEIVDRLPEPQSLVFGCLSDKDVDKIAFPLVSRFANIYVFSPTSYRAMDGEKIYNAFKVQGGNVTLCDNLAQALQKAQTQIVVVCGTFTILKEAREWIKKKQ